MLKKIIVATSFILSSLCITAQNDLNNYKYIIIPKKFDFLKAEDQHQLNSLTKFLFNKYGYQAYFMDDEIPEDLKSDRCIALTSEVTDSRSGMLKTKIQIDLKDCIGNVVMTSEIGESRLKKFEKAYHEALRSAFKTFQQLDYEYVPKEKSIKALEPKIEVEEALKIEVGKIEVLETTAEVKGIKQKVNTTEIYYAQSIDDGYQLVDSEPKIVIILLNTSAKDVFIVKDKNAIVFKENQEWIYSENNGSVFSKVINIKF